MVEIVRGRRSLVTRRWQPGSREEFREDEVLYLIGEALASYELLDEVAPNETPESVVAAVLEAVEDRLDGYLVMLAGRRRDLYETRKANANRAMESLSS